MTETQATSGIAGTSTAGSASDIAAEGVNAASKDATETASGNGRAAVGRASVPAESTGKTTNEAKLDLSTGTSKTGESGNGKADAPGKDSKGVLASSGATTAGAPPKAAGLVGSTTTTGRPPAAPAKPAGPVKSAPAGKPSVEPKMGPTKAVPGTRGAGAPTAGRGPRRARLVLRRLDPWSVMKFSFAVSLVLFVVMIVATAVLYLALDQMGVFESVNKMLNDTLNNNGSGGGLRITAIGVIGTSALLGAVGIVLITALGTLGSFVYNVCADLVGGVEVTLAEKD